MTAMIRQLLDFARRKASQKRSEDLGAIVGQAVTMLLPVARRAGVRVETEPPRRKRRSSTRGRSSRWS